MRSIPNSQYSRLRPNSQVLYLHVYAHTFPNQSLIRLTITLPTARKLTHWHTHLQAYNAIDRHAIAFLPPTEEFAQAVKLSSVKPVKRTVSGAFVFGKAQKNLSLRFGHKSLLKSGLIANVCSSIVRGNWTLRQQLWCHPQPPPPQSTIFDRPHPRAAVLQTEEWFGTGKGNA